jgi:HD-like signal output (HDOD) protein/CheY-like chemotaxis protein
MPVKRLMLVEPDIDVQKMIAGVLGPEERNWALVCTASAEEALALSEAEPFDLVVAAERLPERSGSELLASIKKTSPSTIRFLLVDETEKAALRAMVGEAQQVLLKPLELSSFIQQVNRALSLRPVINDPAILALLGHADSIPPLPRIFQAVSNKLKDPNASMIEVAEIISGDIVLSSKILKLANSALFQLSEPAGSVSHAVALLGSCAVGSLVFSEGLSDVFKGDPETERLAEELNRHSLACATLVSNIMYTWNAGRELTDKAVFCGIAHDLGKLVIARFEPETWKRIQAEVAKGERSDVEIERAALGISHCEIAAYLLTVWGFPNDQVSAIAFHHEPSKPNDLEFGLLCALHLAENCSRSSLHGQHLDWKYLEAAGVSSGDVEALRTLEGSD